MHKSYLVIEANHFEMVLRDSGLLVPPHRLQADAPADVANAERRLQGQRLRPQHEEDFFENSHINARIFFQLHEAEEYVLTMSQESPQLKWMIFESIAFMEVPIPAPIKREWSPDGSLR